MCQRSNQMAIELLNPIEETHHIFQATDKDIYDAVMNAKAARAWERTAAGDSNEPDDADDSESDEPIKPQHVPARRHF